MGIHPTAIVSEAAKLADDVVVGPYVVIRGKTTVGSGTVVDQFASLGSDSTETIIGKNNRIHPGAVIGEVPQDLKYRGELTKLVVGDNNVFREYTTVNAGTPKGGGITSIGNSGLFMSYVHIAHDCKIGDHVVIANSGQLAGHVELANHVKVGGVCCFNQFVRAGIHAYIAGDSTVNKDILPFSIAQGKYAVMRAANQVGMERSGYSKEDILSVRRAIRWITKGGGTVDEALERIEEECEPSEALQALTQFIKESQRGLAL